jgi:hypothetical protein
MSYKIEVNMDNLPKDEEVEIWGLGRFKNQSTTTLSSAQVAQYLAQHARHESGKVDPDTGIAPVVLREATPLVEAFKDVPGVTITEVTAKGADK